MIVLSYNCITGNGPYEFFVILCRPYCFISYIFSAWMNTNILTKTSFCLCRSHLSKQNLEHCRALRNVMHTLPMQTHKFGFTSVSHFGHLLYADNCALWINMDRHYSEKALLEWTLLWCVLVSLYAYLSASACNSQYLGWSEIKVSLVSYSWTFRLVKLFRAISSKNTPYSES